MVTELTAIANWLLKAKMGVIRNIQEDAECKEYSGCNFEVDLTKIIYRKAKITPKLEQTVKFKKDIKLAKKLGLDIQLDEVVTRLVEKGLLTPKNKPHKLTDNYKGFCECHIQPD